jgi:hypothetical protein
VEEIMSLLGDLLKTTSDAMRLGSDVVRYKLEVQRRAVQRKAGRLGICVGVGLIALGFVGAGIALLVYGAYFLVSLPLGPGLAGLIVGTASILLAGLLMLAACSAVRRR